MKKTSHKNYIRNAKKKNAQEMHKKFNINTKKFLMEWTVKWIRNTKLTFKNFDMVMQVYTNDLGKYDVRTCLAIVFSHNSFHVKPTYMRNPNLSPHMIGLLFDILWSWQTFEISSLCIILNSDYSLQKYPLSMEVIGLSFWWLISLRSNVDCGSIPEKKTYMLVGPLKSYILIHTARLDKQRCGNFPSIECFAMYKAPTEKYWLEIIGA